MSISVAGTNQPAESRYRRDTVSDARPDVQPPRQLENATTPIQIGPLPKRTSRRRWRLASLLLAVAIPTAVVGGYLHGYASDQYVTQFRLSIRHQAPLRVDPTGGSAPGESLADAGGSSAMLEMVNDSQIVTQYLKSRQIIDDMAAAGVGLPAIYARGDADWLARMRPNASAEERQRYWQRMVDPFFDQTTGIRRQDDAGIAEESNISVPGMSPTARVMARLVRAIHDLPSRTIPQAIKRTKSYTECIQSSTEIKQMALHARPLRPAHQSPARSAIKSS
jgi:hypothetical protein